MSTVIFDFDSTLIQVESLEEILAPKCAATPGLEAQLREITALGMAGAISFQESLSRRLALASPSRQEVQAFGEHAWSLITPGMEELIGSLRTRGVAVKIISGGLIEAILPCALRLGLADTDVGAVRLNFEASGHFVGIDEADLFSSSKLEGARALAANWTRPLIAIGDGFTDYQLYQQGWVDHFLAFTQWARRDTVVATGAPEARDVRTLIELLDKRL